MAGKKKGGKSGEIGCGYTYDLDAEKRIRELNREKAFIQKMMRFNKKRRKWPDSRYHMMDIKHSDELYLERLKEIDERIALLNSQILILECDDKPVNVQLGKRSLEDELKHAYCAKCASPNLKITRIIQIECRKCGRKRLITSRLDESKR